MPTIVAREPAPQSQPIQPQQKVMYAKPEVQPKPEAVVPEAPQKEQLSPRFAQLARKEAALRAEQQKITAEKEAMKAKLAEYETSYVPKSKLNELAKSNPLAALEQLGLTADEFTQALLNADPKDAKIQKILERLEAVENGHKQTLTNLEMQQEESYKQALTQIKNDMKLTVEADKRFEIVKEADAKGWEATEGAVTLIEEVFKEGWPEKKLPKGTLITNEQALEHIQNWVSEKAYEMAQLPGVKEKFAPVVEVKQEAPTRAPAKTLTQAMNASAPKRLTDKERRDRAILALQGQLN